MFQDNPNWLRKYGLEDEYEVPILNFVFGVCSIIILNSNRSNSLNHKYFDKIY